MLKSAPLFRLKHGNHICVLYSDDSALLETLAPYVADGLRNGERCLCAQKTHMIKRLETALKLIGVDVEHETNRGALEIRTQNEVYLGGGNFDVAAMMQFLETSIAESVKQGFTGFRFAGEVSWAGEGRAHQLIEYERMLDAAYENKPTVIICQYAMNVFSEKTLRDALESHRLALTETMAESNHSSLMIRKGDYFVEIVADRENPGTKFYYVAQQRGSSDILGWGAERSFDDAVREGESLIHELAQWQSPKRRRSSR
ncbi:MAG TPA: MEDS domain-containing protein [Candidatus Angelobacter sp.]|nr:MEDS domain-containing protein [Candidatus Angelobacter sp.]